MAKIFNFELKALKSFTGREGIGFTANLYFKNKKVGEVNDYADGAGTNFDWDYKVSNEIKEQAIVSVRDYYAKYPSWRITETTTDIGYIAVLCDELYELKETEKFFKKQIKKHPNGALLDMRFSRRNVFELGSSPAQMVFVFEYSQENLDKNLEEFKPIEYNVFRDLNDFIRNE